MKIIRYNPEQLTDALSVIVTEPVKIKYKTFKTIIGYKLLTSGYLNDLKNILLEVNIYMSFANGLITFTPKTIPLIKSKELKKLLITFEMS